MKLVISEGRKSRGWELAPNLQVWFNTSIISDKWESISATCSSLRDLVLDKNWKRSNTWLILLRTSLLLTF
jgi:hypothetical protein